MNVSMPGKRRYSLQEEADYKKYKLVTIVRMVKTVPCRSFQVALDDLKSTFRRQRQVVFWKKWMSYLTMLTTAMCTTLSLKPRLHIYGF